MIELVILLLSVIVIGFFASIIIWFKEKWKQ